MALASFDTMTGDVDLLRTAAATVMTMIDQSGLRTDPRFRAIREALGLAMARQGYCNRGNLSDLVRVTLKRRDGSGETLFLSKATAAASPVPAILSPNLQIAVVDRKSARQG